ncbi:MAG TPA: hypothetical protein VLH86_01780 [Patescibacteria group bacterium]|nr:hypothetical protein [Patescibacteria group bacterium]
MAKQDTSEEHIDMSDESSVDDESTQADKPKQDKAEKTEKTDKSPANDSDSKSTDEGSDETASSEDKPEEQPAKTGPHHKAWGWVMGHKMVSIPVAVVLVLAVLAAIPFTRYFFAGMVISKDFTVAITDSQTGKPVTSAEITVAGKKATTDNQGKAKVHTSVGSAKLVISKKYYHDASFSVTVAFSQKQPYAVKLEATGRPIPITIINRISNKPVADITISAENTKAITDAKGEATIVVPADKTQVKATMSGAGYNSADFMLKVTTSTDPANTFAVTPAGKLYYLSNASGKLDVIKSDLDGQNRQTVLAGTGKEDKNNTVLLASRDWKYIALLSKRDGGDNAKLFLIETDTDKLTTMDEGDATFTPYGWSGSRFVYTVDRTKVSIWQPKRQALKSYDASSKGIAVLDQTTAEGDQYNYRGESLGNVYILDKEVVYTKTWNKNGGFDLSSKQATFNSVQADGSQRKTVKGYPPTNSYYLDLNTRPADFNEIYIRYPIDNNGKYKHDAYKDGKITAEDLTDDEFYQGTYNTYIVSPSGNKTFWTEYRDGKNVFFVGDGSGKNGKQLPGSSDDHVAYGWYTDGYLLVTKKSSEMHIMPVDGLTDGVTSAIKVSDYYKPNYYIRGYGYGYGG